MLCDLCDFPAILMSSSQLIGSANWPVLIVESLTCRHALF